MDNPYLKRKVQKSIGTAGRRSENRVAKALGGNTRPASGAASQKGDIVFDQVLLEAKSTARASLRVTLDWLAKISGEARAVGRMPALSLSFTDSRGEKLRDGDWVAIPAYEFERLMIAKAQENEDLDPEMAEDPE